MKKIFNTKIFSIICLLLSVAAFTACDDKEEAISGEVKLLSFGPSGVKPGENISFIGNNLDKVTAIDLTGTSFPSSAFVTHTSELIVLTVPVETDEGLVTLKTTEGDVISKTILSFEVAGNSGPAVPRHWDHSAIKPAPFPPRHWLP